MKTLLCKLNEDFAMQIAITSISSSHREGGGGREGGTNLQYMVHLYSSVLWNDFLEENTLEMEAFPTFFAVKSVRHQAIK